MEIKITLTEEEKKDIITRYISYNILPKGYILCEAYPSLGEFIFDNKPKEDEVTDKL